MKVFFSWSGGKSHGIAKVLADWIPCVVQAVDPWISSKDIDRGSIWFSEISDQLRETNFGVVLVTKENQDRPWLLFEAGALSKGLTESRVCTVLVDLNVRDIDSGSPLRQLNHSMLDKEGVLSLVRTINSRLDSGSLPEKRLEQTFNAMWPELAGRVEEIQRSDPAPTSPERNDQDVLNDILENVLRINKKVSAGVSLRSGPYIDSQHAKILIRNLVKMGNDREDVVEAIEGLAPSRWVNFHLDEYFDRDPDCDPESPV
ncbi:hypothetical protein I5T82_17210 [Stenotrophomonas maltophilia]|nr:hypothetical protein [Stenotrophomonas maltophilia]